jgi:hypothetical protein
MIVFALVLTTLLAGYLIRRDQEEEFAVIERPSVITVYREDLRRLAGATYDRIRGGHRGLHRKEPGAMSTMESQAYYAAFLARLRA